MSELTAELAPKIAEACTANAEELAGAFGRALDGEFVAKPGEATPFEPTAVEGGGLVVTLKFGDAALGVVIPQTAGLLPDWASAPDPTGQSKLDTLAQELSMLVVPDDLMADETPVAWHADLAAKLAEAAPADDAVSAPLELVRGEELGVCRLVWPLTNPGVLVAGDAAAPDAESADDAAPQDPAPSPTTDAAEPDAVAAPDEDAPRPARVLRWSAPMPRDYRDLPPHVVSALRVTVPVSVNLARKHAPVSEIVQLGPGSIITFDKSCDGLLEISAGDRPIAEGEAVKVGEKFGVRVKQMILPHEQFRPMLPAAEPAVAQ